MKYLILAALVLGAAPAFAAEPEVVSVSAGATEGDMLAAMTKICGGKETYAGLLGLDRKREIEHRNACISSLKLDAPTSTTSAVFERARVRMGR